MRKVWLAGPRGLSVHDLLTDSTMVSEIDLSGVPQIVLVQTGVDLSGRDQRVRSTSIHSSVGASWPLRPLL